jgi:hypothetical protein
VTSVTLRLWAFAGGIADIEIALLTGGYGNEQGPHSDMMVGRSAAGPIQ